MLENTTLLITGASRGLGAAIARSASRHGARVIVNYWQSEKAAQALVAELGERALAIRADVRSAAEVQAMVRQAVDWAGRPVNALVNNALVNYQFNGDARHSLDTISWDAMQLQIDGAVRGSLNTLQACRGGMQTVGGGQVVNIVPIYFKTRWCRITTTQQRKARCWRSHAPPPQSGGRRAFASTWCRVVCYAALTPAQRPWMRSLT